MGETMTIGGITPTLLWNTMAGVVLILLLGVSLYKVVEIVRKEKEHHARKKMLTANGDDLTDVIADKVMEKLEPKLAKMDAKLAADKARLDGFESRLNKNDEATRRVGQDMVQILNVLDAMLMHFISGNDHDKLKAVKTQLDQYKNER